MTPSELKTYLNNIVTKKLQISTMIWGAPGIGKSSIVAQVAKSEKIGFIDVRLSQLAPTDLRGLPVAVPLPDTAKLKAGVDPKRQKIEGISKWYPPEFLPREGEGILFLDELNMAPPAMQGMAQQLILDRRVGNYTVPPGWFVWAAGNRKEDRAAVFDMPTPLANRFLHLQVEADFESFKEYAIASGIHEQIVAFLSYRPSLLHKLDPRQPAWPSPRSWEMASQLHAVGLETSPAIGEETTVEFKAYISLYKSLPELRKILEGTGDAIAFPSEPSVRYATTVGLALRSKDAEESYNAFSWLSRVATAEWIQLFVMDMMRQLRSQGKLGKLAVMAQKDPKLKRCMTQVRQLIGL